MRRSQLVVVLCVVSACAGRTQSKTPDTAVVRSVKAAAPEQGAVAAGEHEHMPQWSLAKLAQGAKLLGDLGEVRRAVSTRSRDAQAYFDQGLALTYGFNHDEAARSFAKAAELDPSCAMCFWGAAYTLAPDQARFLRG